MKCILLLFSVCFGQGLVAQTTFHGNMARTGVYESTTLRQLKGVQWKFKTEGPIVSSPAIAYGLVFVGSADNHLYAIDQKTGQQKWTFQTSGKVNSSPAIADSIIYFGSSDGHVYAVNAITGVKKWQFATEYERHYQAKGLHGLDPRTQVIPDSWDVFTSSPAVFNGRVYIGSGDGNIYALDTQTGLIRWKFQTADVVHASPALANNWVYIGSWDGSFYALDAESGQEKWRFKAGVDPVNANHIGFQSSAVVVDETVYVGCRDAHVYALEAATGRKKWEYSTKTSWVSASPIVRNGTVFINSNRLMALDAQTGHLKFTFDEPKVWGISSPIIAGEQVFMGGFNGILYALDAKTGKTSWSFQTEGSKNDLLHVLNPDGTWNKSAFGAAFYDFEDDYVDMYKRFSVGSIMSTPTIDQGALYVGSTDGFLYALY